MNQGLCHDEPPEGLSAIFPGHPGKQRIKGPVGRQATGMSQEVVNGNALFIPMTAAVHQGPQGVIQIKGAPVHKRCHGKGCGKGFGQ